MGVRSLRERNEDRARARLRFGFRLVCRLKGIDPSTVADVMAEIDRRVSGCPGNWTEPRRIRSLPDN